ncbi:disks large homolog 1-like [Rhipicephalus sanguineus]|uniref:disks large homolog 1-like n=1 Tax=Rhipicephalus sanguineus TaxID=34632 RepID=UPI0020C3A711|nr:disks large homolog 1-like [Rhipicephalus sanguineus]
MEAHRALELLEEYHSKLSKPQDKQLRNAIERVIRIFKSRLFQALLDIQEFYEITLLDDTKSIQQKTAETLQIACKWENSPPITGTHSNSTEKYRYPEEVDLPPTSSRLKDVDGLGTSVDHYSSSAVESPRKVSGPNMRLASSLFWRVEDPARICILFDASAAVM